MCEFSIGVPGTLFSKGFAFLYLFVLHINCMLAIDTLNYVCVQYLLLMHSYILLLTCCYICALLVLLYTLCVRVCVCACACVCVCMCVRACMHMYVYICMCAYIYVCACMYIYICVCVCVYIIVITWAWVIWLKYMHEHEGTQCPSASAYMKGKSQVPML